MTQPRARTTVARAQAFDGLKPTVDRMLVELKALAQKKPHTELAPTTVSLINRALKTAKNILQDEPEAQYLERLRGSALTVTEAVLILAQYDTAMNCYSGRYKNCDAEGYNYYWYVSNGQRSWRIKAEPWGPRHGLSA